MKKRMQCKGFKISERNDGTFKIEYVDSYGFVWNGVCKNFFEAGQWVWNMADNHDVARIVNRKMCDAWGKTFFSDAV